MVIICDWTKYSQRFRRYQVANELPSFEEGADATVAAFIPTDKGSDESSHNSSSQNL